LIANLLRFEAYLTVKKNQSHVNFFKILYRSVWL